MHQAIKTDASDASDGLLKDIANGRVNGDALVLALAETRDSSLRDPLGPLKTTEARRNAALTRHKDYFSFTSDVIKRRRRRGKDDAVVAASSEKGNIIGAMIGAIQRHDTPAS